MNLEARLMQGDFDGLDSRADQYRTTRALNSAGYWALGSLYDAMSSFASSGCGCQPGAGGIPFETKRKQLETWLAKKPQSLTARIALADIWRIYADTQRSDKAAAEVTDAQWQGYHDALGRADEWLRDIDPTGDPMVYSIKMQIAVGSNNPRQTLDDLYAKAIKAFPTFIPYYTTRYRFLQERWFGEPGESTQYIASLLQTPGGDDGKMIYVAVAATALDFERAPNQLLAVSGVDYDKLVDAFGALQRKVGVNAYSWNVLMYYASAALDRDGVFAASKKIGDRWDRGIWGTKEFYQSWIDWAARAI